MMMIDDEVWRPEIGDVYNNNIVEKQLLIVMC
jgi:hypothetical protein